MALSSLPSTLADRYRIEKELGRGGMAVVYLAEDLKHGRRVAVKVMRPEMAAAVGQDRFLREIETAARLTHPHIVPLYDSGAAEGHFYYVMPYVEGESLRARLDREHQLPLDDALRLTREIAGALSHSHRQGLVHRDIKPENVLLADGIALVADFGIAKALRIAETDATQALTGGALIGTPAYMAPEQASGGEVDPRADLYALACVLYEMLAGEPPFTGRDPQSLLHQHLNAVPRPVSERRQVPPGVDAAVARGLAKLPVDRFPTAAAFAEALALAAGGIATPTPAPGREATATPNNLPKQRTHFIGREKELAEYARLLGEASLVTLTGIGGCGKTRLALELAGRLLATYPEGVWLADLAPVLDPDRVPLRVASAMGVKEIPGVPIASTLAEAVADRRILLVLDNCEHVLGQAADLVDSLLTSCPGLRIVATSREGLGVPGEHPVSVRSLPVPGARTTDLSQVEAAEAVRLFLDRAHVVAPGFQLTPANASPVVEIVRRLDGIPLALELAAARMKILSVEQIRDKLDDRFRLLTGTSRALPRHQTLRATIQWSHDHLDEEERRLFRLLSVFSGGWDLEGATAVTGPDADEFAIMDLLSRLVDKSLVFTERGNEDAVRYGMLETVRQFAQEMLEATGEGDEARTRHLDHYLDLVRLAAPHLAGPEHHRWMARLTPELENLLLAFAWCERAPEGDRKGLGLAAATGRFWEATSLVLGFPTLASALDRAEAWIETEDGCDASLWAGVLAYRMGRYEMVSGYLETMLRVARLLEDKGRISQGLHWSAHAYYAAGKPVDVQALYTESIALARESGNRAALSSALIGMGEHLRFSGDLEGSLVPYQEALDLAREEGNDRTTVIALLNQARALIPLGRLDAVPGMARESLARFEPTGQKGAEVSWLEVLAGIAVTREEWIQAARFHGASDAIHQDYNYQREPADAAYLEPLMERVRQALGAEAQETARRAGAALTQEAMIAEGRNWLESIAPDRDGETR